MKLPDSWDEPMNPGICLTLVIFPLAAVAMFVSGFIGMTMNAEYRSYQEKYTVGTCYISDCTYQIATKEVHFTLTPYEFYDRSIRSSLALNLLEGKYFCDHIKEERCLYGRDGSVEECRLDFTEPPTGEWSYGVMVICMQIMAGTVLLALVSRLIEYCLTDQSLSTPSQTDSLALKKKTE